MSYWSDRVANSQAKLSKKKIQEIEKQLAKYYTKASITCIEGFEATYNKILSTLDEGKTATPADLYKLDKYWQLQAQLKAELDKLGNKQLELFQKQFTEHFINVYESLAWGGLPTYSTLDTAAVNQVINAIWCADGKNWSSRIWKNTEYLMETLNEELISVVATGKPAKELKNKLQERFNVSYSQADSIVRTEVAHIQTQAARKRYEDAGLSKVQVWADYDERRCEVCGKLHEKTFFVNEPIPIPAHPRCRCCIVPVLED